MEVCWWCVQVQGGQQLSERLQGAPGLPAGAVSAKAGSGTAPHVPREHLLHPPTDPPRLPQ